MCSRSTPIAPLLCLSLRIMLGGQRTVYGGALRRLCAPAVATAVTSLSAPATPSLHRRSLSTSVVQGEAEQWAAAMANKYGAGNYQLFRPLYKDLCDEVRREYYTKPPAPPSAAAARRRAPEVAEAGDSREGEVSGASETTSAAAAAAHDGTSSPPHPTPPETTYGDGTWSVDYRAADNVVTFDRFAVKEGRLSAVHAWSRVELKDPQRLNAVLSFADWIPIEICVERNGVMIHFSMASNEGGMHMRNVRVYAPNSAEERAALLDPSDDGEYARKKFYYDGPCLWHLELDFQNELYDVMQDHGVSLEWVQWVASWVFYLEYVAYVKWNLGLLEELIPSAVRGAESDFLTAEEKALLEEPVEDWLEAHTM